MAANGIRYILGVVFVLDILLCQGVVAHSLSCTFSLSRCDCTILGTHIRTINCTNTGYTSDNHLGTLIDDAPFVETLKFTGNNITSLSANLFGECPGHKYLYNLTYLDLSNNNIHVIQGKSFHCLIKLQTLVLNDNFWNVNPNKYRVFSSISSLRALHLDNAFAIKDHLIPLKSVFSDDDTPDIEELHLARNSISHMDSDIFCNLKKLKSLHLSNNRLAKIGLNPTCMKELEEIYLDDNNFMYLSSTDISVLQNMTTVVKMDLRINPFDCRDCTKTMADFRNWLKTDAGAIVIERETLFCKFPAELEGKDLMDLTDGNMEGTCAPNAPYHRSNNQVTVIVLTMVFLSLVLVVTIVVFVNRERIQRDGCWVPFKDGTRNILRRTLHLGYSSMENDRRDILEEEMSDIVT